MSTVSSPPSAHRSSPKVPDYTPPVVQPGTPVRIAPDPSFSGTANSLGFVLHANEDRRTLTIVELWGRGINRRAESYHVDDPYCQVRSHLFTRGGNRIGCWKHLEGVEAQARAVLALVERFGSLERMVISLTARIVTLEKKPVTPVNKLVAKKSP